MQPVHSQAEADISLERSRFKRLVIASQDLDEARLSVNRLAGLNGKAAPAREDEDLRAALLTSAVIAYGRLFRLTRPSASVPGHLPERLVTELDPSEQRLHQRLIALRDQEFAHSDAVVADVKVTARTDIGGGLLLPESRILRKFSVAHTDLLALDRILGKVHAYIYDEMMRLYPILAPHGDF